MASVGASLEQFMRRCGPLHHRVGTVVLAALLTAAGGPAQSRSVPATEATEAAVAVTSLPQEARTTTRLIRNGGPFPFEKDGVVFFNRERLLPRAGRGYYREYTVPTPGSRTRGARRIVCGGLKAATPDACYYSDDHYASFRRIVQ